jgi:hypothetical protein
MKPLINMLKSVLIAGNDFTALVLRSHHMLE